MQSLYDPLVSGHIYAFSGYGGTCKRPGFGVGGLGFVGLRSEALGLVACGARRTCERLTMCTYEVLSSASP